MTRCPCGFGDYVEGCINVVLSHHIICGHLNFDCSEMQPSVLNLKPPLLYHTSIELRTQSITKILYINSVSCRLLFLRLHSAAQVNAEEKGSTTTYVCNRASMQYEILKYKSKVSILKYEKTQIKSLMTEYSSNILALCINSTLNDINTLHNWQTANTYTNHYPK